jgi:hypothetical protein
VARGVKIRALLRGIPTTDAALRAELDEAMTVLETFGRKRRPRPLSTSAHPRQPVIVPTGPPPHTRAIYPLTDEELTMQATVIGSYYDGTVTREFPTTDATRARTLADGRLARSFYQPDGLMHLAVIPTDAKGHCARCAGYKHVPEYCPRNLR